MLQGFNNRELFLPLKQTSHTKIDMYKVYNVFYCDIFESALTSIIFQKLRKNLRNISKQKKKKNFKFSCREYKKKQKLFIDSLKPLHYALLHSKYAVPASTKQCSLQVYFLCSIVYKVDSKLLATAYLWHILFQCTTKTTILVQVQYRN